MQLKKDLENLLNKKPSYYKKRLSKSYPKFKFEKDSIVVLFGAAEMGKIYIREFQKNSIKVAAICDNDPSKHGQKILGIKIISPEELVSKFSTDTPIVIASIHEKEIGNQVAKLGFRKVWDFKYFSVCFPRKIENPHWLDSIGEIIANKNKVLEVFDLLNDNKSKKTFLGVIKYRLLMDIDLINQFASNRSEEYFNNDIVMLSSNEIYVDGGAFDGDSILKFLEANRNNFEKIYAFEPDSRNYKKLKNSVGKLMPKLRTKIKILKLGLGSRKEKLFFSDEGSLGSRISSRGKLVKINSLDNLLKSERISLIKMDIEGAEIDALKGSKQIIKKYKPKLVICIYHKPSHLFDVPILIKKLNPSYNFYVRHYSNSVYDTVLYAI